MAEKKINEKTAEDVLKEGEILLIKATKVQQEGEEGIAVEAAVNCTGGEILKVMNNVCERFGLVCVPQEIIASMLLPGVMMVPGAIIADILSELQDEESEESEESSEDNLPNQ